MKLEIENSVDFLYHSMREFFNIQDYKDILKFALQDVDLSDDVSSEKSRIDLVNYPYMVEPLSKCMIEEGKRKEVVICWPQQFGKTLVQMTSILFNSVYNQLQSIIVYPSLDLAVETSTVKFIPLFKKIPQFKQEIEKPYAIRSDRLKLSNSITYFQGAGAKVVSKSAKLVLGDQCAVWENPPNVNNINELKKRTRSYNQCLQLFVSTPRYKQDPFWREFLNGSQGYYYLRCQHCWELTIRSCDIHHLQFQSEYNEELKQYVAIPGTERLICPSCKHEHTEADREQMVKQGGYIHKFPERVNLYPSYQAGVLASLLNTHQWSNIANIQLASGKSATLEEYISLDNSIRGLPYQQRDFNKQDETALSKHYFKPQDLKKQDIEAVIIAADTQMTFSVSAVIALTKDNNYWLLQIDRPQYMWLEEQERKIINAEKKRNGQSPVETLLDKMDKEYYGIKPLCMMVDERGNRSQEVKNFSRIRKNIIMYGGTNLKYDKWKPAETVPKMFICDAKSYQAQLIFMLYFQHNKQANYLFLPCDISEKDVNEILSFRPQQEKRNGNLFENWDPQDRVHDCFDTIKMGLACFEICAKIFRKERFIHGEARVLNPNVPKKETPQKKKKFIPQRRPVFKRY